MSNPGAKELLHKLLEAVEETARRIESLGLGEHTKKCIDAGLNDTALAFADVLVTAGFMNMAVATVKSLNIKEDTPTEDNGVSDNQKAIRKTIVDFLNDSAEFSAVAIHRDGRVRVLMDTKIIATPYQIGVIAGMMFVAARAQEGKDIAQQMFPADIGDFLEGLGDEVLRGIGFKMKLNNFLFARDEEKPH